MSPESFESQQKPEPSPKEVFISALEEALVDMEESGRITTEQAREKRESAALIETNFSADPAHDALLFSRAGITGEKEMVDILDNKNPNEENLEAPQALIEYEKWWSKTYGKEITQTEQQELVGFVQELAKTDEEFRKILFESFISTLTENDNGIEDSKNRKWLFISSLSTYGQKFGLHVD
jgi:hypothetical protein